VTDQHKLFACPEPRVWLTLLAVAAQSSAVQILLPRVPGCRGTPRLIAASRVSGDADQNSIETEYILCTPDMHY
jgi:hypothetical protein